MSNLSGLGEIDRSRFDARRVELASPPTDAASAPSVEAPAPGDTSDDGAFLGTQSLSNATMTLDDPMPWEDDSADHQPAAVAVRPAESPVAPVTVDYTNAHIPGACAAMTFLGVIGGGDELARSLASTGKGKLGNQDVEVSQADRDAVKDLPEGQRGVVLAQLAITRLISQDPNATFKLAPNAGGLPTLVSADGTPVAGVNSADIKTFYEGHGQKFLDQNAFLNAMSAASRQDKNDGPPNYSDAQNSSSNGAGPMGTEQNGVESKDVDAAKKVLLQLIRDQGGQPCFSVSVDGVKHEVQLDHIDGDNVYLKDQPNGGIVVQMKDLLNFWMSGAGSDVGNNGFKNATRYPHG